MKYLDYLGVLALYIVIFASNLFGSLLLLDYVPSNFIFKDLAIQRVIFQIFFGNPITLTISLAVLFLLSYHFIKKLSKYPLLTGLIFLFNPFVYSRIMVGQFGILASYLLLPMFLYFIIHHPKNIKAIALSFTAVSFFAPHFLVINGIILVVALAYRKITIKNFAIIFGIIILLNAFWIQSLFNSQIFQDINTDHEQFFSPKISENISSSLKVAGMYGFWREAGYITAYKVLPLALFYLSIIILIILLLTGFYTSKDKNTRIFYTLWWIGLIIAIGISNPYTKDIMEFLFNNIPFFNGLRDSHKLVALVALGYAFVCPMSIDYLKKKFKYISTIILVLAILALSFPLINLSNQIHSTSYPASYQETNTYLKTKDIKGHIIYLPWETYFTYNWSRNASTDGRMPTPINSIVKEHVIFGSDPYGSSTELMHNINNCLNQTSIECLEQQGVQFILKDDCASYPKNYEWINIMPVHQDNCITIYEITPNYEVKEKINISQIIGISISLITLIVVLFWKKISDLISSY